MQKLLTYKVVYEQKYRLCKFDEKFEILLKSSVILTFNCEFEKANLNSFYEKSFWGFSSFFSQ